MQTLPVPAKNVKALRATLRDEPGAVSKLDGAILFFSDAGEIIEIEPEDCVWLCILGEIGLAETARILDAMHGGAAVICTSRQMEVA